MGRKNHRIKRKTKKINEKMMEKEKQLEGHEQQRSKVCYNIYIYVPRPFNYPEHSTLKRYIRRKVDCFISIRSCDCFMVLSHHPLLNFIDVYIYLSTSSRLKRICKVKIMVYTQSQLKINKTLTFFFFLILETFKETFNSR